MKQTSLEAYYDIQASGDLGRCKKLVLQSLVNAGPATGREINERLGGQGYHKRLSELKRDGWICEFGTRKCTITGRRSTVWVASHGVRKAKPNKSRSDKIQHTADQVWEYFRSTRVVNRKDVERIISRGMK